MNEHPKDKIVRELGLIPLKRWDLYERIILMKEEIGHLRTEILFLREYAQHKFDCDILKNLKMECNCGLAALLDVNGQDTPAKEE